MSKDINRNPSETKHNSLLSWLSNSKVSFTSNSELIGNCSRILPMQVTMLYVGKPKVKTTDLRQSFL